MDDKVQLSRETIVGDEVVNEDIYPNTNTTSVNDDQSGTSLNETIERIWAAINNALARRVNSVNGRTGVVVLDSSDVGLENVDNISFNDIKSWVIDELNKQFGYKKIKLFANQTELETVITANNLDDAFGTRYHVAVAVHHRHIVTLCVVRIDTCSVCRSYRELRINPVH